MKATGIVRKIDDLGRIVIPKEIRRTLRISRGDPLELYIDATGDIIFKKYSLMGELTKIINCCCESLYKITNLPIIICSKEQIIEVCGMPKKEYLGRRISSFITDLNSLNSTYIPNKDSDFLPIEGLNEKGLMISPVKSLNNIIGFIIILKKTTNQELSTETILKLTEIIASIIGKLAE